MLRRLALGFGLLALAAAPLAAQPATPPAAPTTGDPSFNLINRSRVVINEVYASLVTERDWGSDRLGTSTVPAGGTFPIRLPQGACNYDIRVVYQGLPAEERRGVNLCTLDELVFTGQAAAAATPGGKPGTAAAPVGPVGNPSFNVVNRTQLVIREIYVSAAAQNEWGPDILGREVLQIGAHFEVRLAEGPCLYDVRVVFMNGSNSERRRINTCDIANIVFP